MPQSPLGIANRALFRPVSLFRLLFAISGLGALCLVVSAWNYVDRHHDDLEHSLKLLALHRVIVECDAALTDITDQAASFGNPEQIEDYKYASNRLDQALIKARQNFQEPELVYTVEALEGVNADLVSLEAEAFRLVAANQREAADALIHATRYRDAKAAYRRHADRLLEAIQTEILAHQDRSRRHARTFLLGFATALALFLSIWYGLFLRIQKREKALAENQALRQKDRAQLREQKTILKLFVENTPAAIAMLDKDLKYLQTSRQWLREYRLGNQDLIGSHLYDHYPVSEERKEAHQRVLQGHADICHGRAFQSQGREIWYRWQHLPWFDDQGEVGGITMFVENITDRKHMEQALVQAQEKYRRLLKYMPDIVGELKLDGTIEFINRPLPSSETASKSIFDALPESVHKAVTAMIERVADQGITQSLEVCLDPDQQSQWFKLRLAPIYDGLKMEHLLLIMTDISLQKEMEKAREESQQLLEQRVRERTVELEVVNEEVRSFAYIISHDLRAPLVNIRGFVGELKFAFEAIQKTCEQYRETFDDQEWAQMTVAMSEDVPEAMGFIESSVTHMDKLISAVLKLSRIGRQELHLQRVDMTRIVLACLENLAYRIEQESIQVIVEDLPDVCADLTAMTQICANIISNAVNYLDPERPGRIRIWGEETGGYIWFHIADNGRGIASQDIPKVFEIFRRVGTPDRPGEGMGMAYVKALVQRHGGKITCSSKPGEGTTFTFSIMHLTPPETTASDPETAGIETAMRTEDTHEHGSH